MSPFRNKTLRDINKNFGAPIWCINLTRIFLVFSPSVRVKHFWVDLDGRHVSAPTSSVGVVYMWVMCM